MRQYGGEWSVLRLSPFTPKESAPDALCNEGSSKLTRLFGEEKNILPLPAIEQRSLCYILIIIGS
jgi:hypothetical protein